MDGEEGEDHPRLGARWMQRWFDPVYPTLPEARTWYGRLLDSVFGKCGYVGKCGPYTEWVYESWYNFTFYHSRFMAKRYGHQFSRLCVADKLSFCLEPRWLYLPRVIATGEIQEYMAIGHTRHKNEPKTDLERYLLLSDDVRYWHEGLVKYVSRWVEAHKDLQSDEWTPVAAGNSNLD